MAASLSGSAQCPCQFSDVAAFDEDEAVFFRDGPLFGRCNRTLEPNYFGAEWKGMIRNNSRHFLRRTMHAYNVRAGGPATQPAENEKTLLVLFLRRKDAARILVRWRAGRKFSLRVAPWRITEHRKTRLQQCAGHSGTWPIHQQDHSRRFENKPGICHILNTIIRAAATEAWISFKAVRVAQVGRESRWRRQRASPIRAGRDPEWRETLPQPPAPSQQTGCHR